MLVDARNPIPPLHHRTTAIIVIDSNRKVKAATGVKEKIALLSSCLDEDLVLVAICCQWTVDVFTVSAQQALGRLLQEIPASPDGYFKAFGEKP
jgi:hypothetical protein